MGEVYVSFAHVCLCISVYMLCVSGGTWGSACPGVICELCRHVGHVHEWVREMGLCEGGGWMGVWGTSTEVLTLLTTLLPTAMWRTSSI